MEKGSANTSNSGRTGYEEFAGPLFVAIPIPVAGKEILTSFVNGNSHLSSIRWIPEANYHVTLLYIGRVEKIAVPVITSALGGVLATIPAFELIFRDFSVIQKKGRENMIWARYDANEGFSLCSLKIREALSPLADIQSSFLKPLPHTTLARFKNREAAEGLNYPVHLPEIHIPVNYCELWETNRAEKGVWYKRKDSFMLISP